MSAVELERIQPSLKALAHLAARLGVNVGAVTEDSELRVDSLAAANAALDIVSKARHRAKSGERDVLLAAEFALSSTARTLAERRRSS